MLLLYLFVELASNLDLRSKLSYCINMEKEEEEERDIFLDLDLVQ